VTRLPDELVLGPVAARLRVWEVSHGGEVRSRTREALATPRYLRLLDALDSLVRQPPLRAKAAGKPARTMARAVLKEYGRLAGRMERAMAQPAGRSRESGLHEARKAAKKLRYAAEVARPALGKPVARLGKRAKAVQRLLGEHQDAVVAQETLRELAVAAHGAGESAFTWGLLYGLERAGADARQRELPEVWRKASDPSLRAALDH
jgi:CHAD domain-containing protein